MSVIYTDAMKAARMTATRDTLAGGTLEIGSGSFSSVFIVFALSSVGGTVSGDTWTLGFNSPTVAVSTAGTGSAARVKDKNGVVQISGLTVGTTGTDITIVDGVAFTKGQNVTLSTATIKHA